MNNLFKIHTRALPLAFVALFGNANAQTAKPLETRTDEKYSNTTIVYRNDKNASDAVILSQIEKEYGMGDVVRIAEAPPKPKVAPALAKTETIKPAAVKPSVARVPAKATTAKQENVALQATKPAPAASFQRKSAAAATPVNQFVAADDPAVAMKIMTAAPAQASAAKEYSNASQKPETTQPETFKTAAAPLAKTAVVHKSTTKTTAAAGNSAPKTGAVKTTGKLYKHKKKSGFGLNLNILPKGGKSGKQSYRCYKF